MEQSPVWELVIKILVNWKYDTHKVHSAQSSDTEDKKFVLKTGAEAEWRHDCPHLMSEDMSPFS
jgi:hypothetical protein